MSENLFSACACAGPMYGEPLCPCQMKSSGLPLNTTARDIAQADAKRQLAAMFAPGGIFHHENPSDE